MSQIPDRTALLAFLDENPEASRRDVARAFGLRGADRDDLKRLLREMEEEGVLRPRRERRREGGLPPVTVVEVTGTDRDGDLLARPLEWHGEGEPPPIRVEGRARDRALGPGDRLLARIAREGEGHVARPIKRLAAAPARVLGLFHAEGAGGRIVPLSKGEGREWIVGPGDAGGAQEGELVEAEAVGRERGRLGLPRARVVERLGDPSAPRALSLIAIHEHGIPETFDPAALEEAERAVAAGPEGREDLRDLPFVTIDPEDARDRDDAVLAVPEEGGGFTLWVAIADVAFYVRPGSALDAEARLRGNSTYFPDRVVPMLPERLSGDLCSLHAGVDRAVIAVAMRIDAEGRKTGHRFVRGLIRSRASLAYEAAQRAADGQPDETTGPLWEGVLRRLFAAHRALARAREARGPLELDLPERRIVLDEGGRVVSVAFRERLEAHRLIEEFMILANVAAAEELVARRVPLLFRVHEEPDPLKLEALRETAEASGLALARGQVLRTTHLNRLLAQAAGTDQAELINMATLRSLPQAFYAPDNLGHFGLALQLYAHFTSPIRRYADLIVHRALIAAHGWGPDPAADGLGTLDRERLEETGELISAAERRSMQAERDTTDRYLAAYLSERRGTEARGRISGVQRFGLFVRLDETGADGLVPVRSLGEEFWRFDARDGTLTGSESGVTFAAGLRVLVRIAEVSTASGAVLLELLELEDAPLRRRRGRKGAAPRREGRRVLRRRKG
ncbi:ribonuclease R [Rubellimicrobium sp. CFH 75288]|uniref:ribonuclease R n=1 Tax=Rubellimicrobium sp. CFH 75288 TaxID=2697034 RepID=UPI0014132AA2|nr:ribonuclease R [Rubellimicrobium sp. CFH 75288]NAZ38291.1 ribonuclease R [Rubellimicrobium sp. CFH 75288]